jgi:hypothetical protein
MPPVLIRNNQDGRRLQRGAASHAAAYRAKFSDLYVHRVITGRVGHNLSQEAPAAFVQAVIEVGKMAGWANHPSAACSNN